MRIERRVSEILPDIVGVQFNTGIFGTLYTFQLEKEAKRKPNQKNKSP